MNENIQKIKKMVELECASNPKIEDWFFVNHLCAVEEAATFLLQSIPEANAEIVYLGVWLHDIQRYRSIDGDHQSAGAKESQKVLAEYGYSDEVKKQVHDMICTHSCDEDSMPVSLEAKVLATADAMAHYMRNFYLYIAVQGKRNFEEYRKWALEKLERDYSRKIHFDFAREVIKDRHDMFMKLFSIGEESIS